MDCLVWLQDIAGIKVLDPQFNGVDKFFVPLKINYIRRKALNILL